MFEKLADKLVKGVISLSFLLFSSYEGNNASFNTPQLELHNKGISCKTELVGAFDNDFEDVFKSGEEVSLDYTVVIIADGEQHSNFTHNLTVEYNPMDRTYELKSDSGGLTKYFSEIDEMVEAFAQFDKLLPLPDCDNCIIKISAKLNKLFFASQQKEFDLNLLWKNKLPELTIKLNPVDLQ